MRTGPRTAIGAVALLLLAGCAGEAQPEIVAGIDACAQCNMVIDQVGQACGYLLDGDFVTFDSPRCLLQSYDELRQRGEELPASIFFADYESTVLRPAESVTFLLTDHVPTVMQGGVICFGSRPPAERARSHEDEILTDWTGYRTARGEPDRVIETVFEPGGMSPPTVEADKGELILWSATARGLERNLTISIKGYPEAGVLMLPLSGEAVEFRLIVSRPGAGFPVIDEQSGEPLGMLKVAGSHTLEEEAM